MSLRQFAFFVFLGLFAFPAAALVAHPSVVSDCTILSRNLKVGMSGEDVRLLQMLLNGNKSTRLVGKGVGSQGFESTYFGGKTMEAVVRFQNLYAKEVLAPVGLTFGNGVVGNYTRAKLLALCTSISSTTALSSSDTAKLTPPSQKSADSSSIATPVLENSAPQLNRPSSYVVSPGDKISISGLGFTSSENILHIGSLAIPNLNKDLLGSLELNIPLDAPKGKFDLSVSNANGESNKSFLIIVQKGTAPPVVKSFSPIRGSDGTQVSVTGEGFTKENNEIYFGSTPQKGISSADGKKLTFTLSMGLPGFSASGATSTSTAPIWFYVVNANGISNEGIFSLMF